MNISTLIKKSADQGVLLYVEDNNLKFKLTVQEFPPQLKQEIIDNKSEIIKFLALEASVKRASDKVIPKLTGTDKLRASFAQQRLWFIDKLRGGSAEYNMSAAFTVKGTIDVGVLTSVFNRIVQRHQVLRTVLTEVDGELYQNILSLDDIDFNLQQIDLTTETKAQQEQRIEQLLLEDATTPFDLV